MMVLASEPPRKFLRLNDPVTLIVPLLHLMPQG
jgi:hypothetical protein